MPTDPHPAPTAAEREDYLIWSYEHNAWWKPNRCGYTADLLDAGLYRRVEALAIEANANRCSAEPHELAIPVRDRARTLQHIVERAQRMLAAIEPDSAALASARAELARVQSDMREAAGNLLVPVPEPGSDMSKVICANVLLKHERDEALDELARVREVSEPAPEGSR